MWQERSEPLSFEFQVGSRLCGGQWSKPGDCFPRPPCQQEQLEKSSRINYWDCKTRIFLLLPLPTFLSPLPTRAGARVSNDVWRKRWFPLLSLWGWRSLLSGLVRLIQTPASWPLGQAQPCLASLARPPASQAGEGLLINSLPSKSDAKASPSAGLRKSSYQISKMQLDLQVSSEI